MQTTYLGPSIPHNEHKGSLVTFFSRPVHLPEAATDLKKPAASLIHPNKKGTREEQREEKEKAPSTKHS